MFLEAVVVIGIVLAFVMPGAAMITNVEKAEIEKATTFSLPNFLGRNSGWVEQASGFWEPSRGIDYVCAVDENIVWAKNYDGSGAGEIIREFTVTTDGGTTWEADAMFGAPDDGDPAMIFAVDADHAWVPLHSGDPQGIWATTNGGDNWVQQTTAAFSGSGAFPNIVHFWDENNGWCQGDPVDGYYEMYTTTDGGNNWVRVPSENIPAPLSGEYGTIGYYDVVGDTVWFSTQNGDRVFRSLDRGLQWTVAETPFDLGTYPDVRFKDQLNGLIMDKTAEGVGPLAESSDGGDTWTLVDYTGTCYNADFDYVPGTSNMYVSTGVFTSDPLLQGASYSYDGGHTWTTWSEMEGTQMYGTDWVEGRIGWAGAFNVDEFTGGIWKYTPPPNEPPTAPVIDGETSGDVGTPYEYGFTSTDPDGNDIAEYIVNWGDGTGDETITGPFVSGEEATASHTWTTGGDFVITGKAKDTNDAVGPEGTLSVTMPRGIISINTMFLRFLENFPHAFPLLRHLLGL